MESHDHGVVTAPAAVHASIKDLAPKILGDWFGCHGEDVYISHRFLMAVWEDYKIFMCSMPEEWVNKGSNCLQLTTLAKSHNSRGRCGDGM